MTAFGPTIIFDQSVGGNVRLKGALAPGAVLTNGNTYRERLRMWAGALDLHVRVKMAVSAGIPTIQFVPETANIFTNDLTISDCTAGLTAAQAITNNVEAQTSYTPEGELFIDVVIDCTPASAAGVITYVDVSTRTQS